MGGGGRRLDDRGWVSKTECVRGRKEREKMGDERGKGISQYVLINVKMYTRNSVFYVADVLECIIMSIVALSS